MAGTLNLPPTLTLTMAFTPLSPSMPLTDSTAPPHRLLSTFVPL